MPRENICTVCGRSFVPSKKRRMNHTCSPECSTLSRGNKPARLTPELERLRPPPGPVSPAVFVRRCLDTRKHLKNSELDPLYPFFRYLVDYDRLSITISYDMMTAIRFLFRYVPPAVVFSSAEWDDVVAYLPNRLKFARCGKYYRRPFRRFREWLASPGRTAYILLDTTALGLEPHAIRNPHAPVFTPEWVDAVVLTPRADLNGPDDPLRPLLYYLRRTTPGYTEVGGARVARDVRYMLQRLSLDRLLSDDDLEGEILVSPERFTSGQRRRLNRGVRVFREWRADFVRYGDVYRALGVVSV